MKVRGGGQASVDRLACPPELTRTPTTAEKTSAELRGLLLDLESECQPVHVGACVLSLALAILKHCLSGGRVGQCLSFLDVQKVIHGLAVSHPLAQINFGPGLLAWTLPYWARPVELFSESRFSCRASLGCILHGVLCLVFLKALDFLSGAICFA